MAFRTTTATEIAMMQQQGRFHTKAWGNYMLQHISEELELAEQKHWPDWRPKDPDADQKQDTVSIRRPPTFTLRSFGSRRSSKP